MRIIKELSIEGVHVTIFKMDNRFTLKLEWNRLEQVTKLDMRDGIDDVRDIMSLINEDFIRESQKVFEMMLDNKNRSLEKIRSADDEEFPDII